MFEMLEEAGRETGSEGAAGAGEVLGDLPGAFAEERAALNGKPFRVGQRVWGRCFTVGRAGVLQGFDEGELALVKLGAAGAGCREGAWRGGRHGRCAGGRGQGEGGAECERARAAESASSSRWISAGSG